MPTFTRGAIRADITLTSLTAGCDSDKQYYSASITFDLKCTIAGHEYPVTQEWLEDWMAGGASGGEGFNLTTAIEFIAEQEEPDWGDIADQLWDDADELDGDIRAWLVEVADVSIGMQREICQTVVERANAGEYGDLMAVTA